jgi:hypothetical protein
LFPNFVLNLDFVKDEALALLEGVNEDEAPPEGFIEDECLWVTALIDLSVQNRKTCQFEEESMS